MTWQSCKIPLDQLLEINVNGSGVAMGFLAGDGALNDGSEVISQDWPAGTYRITIGTPLYPGDFYNSALAIYDRSDNVFNIVEEEDCAEGTIIGYNSDGTPIYCGDEGSSCNENDVEVWLENTPSGVQPIDQFNVLRFQIDNNSGCSIVLEDLSVAYMTTDGKPYFDEIRILDDQGNMYGENDELLTDVNFHLGENINIPLSQPLVIEDEGDVELTLRLVNYDQLVFDNSVPYNEYIHKNLMFGFNSANNFDLKWANGGSPLTPSLDQFNSVWGERVIIPVSSLSI